MLHFCDFQEGVPVQFDLPEPSPGTTVALMDQNPSQVTQGPAHLGSLTP